MNYKIVKYSEIGKIRSGKRLPKGYTVSEKISDNKYIRVRDINSGSIASSIVQYITDEAAEKLERYKVKTRDVIISVVGTVGAIAQIDESLNGAYLTENCDNLQVDESLCLKDYLKYYLLSEDGSKEIIANTVGSTQPKLPIYGIENFNIKLPSIDNQKRIVKLLNSIDKKIKLNNEINNNLYEFNNKLFEEKILNNAEKYDWEEYLLSDISKMINGYSYKGNELVEKSNIGMATIKNFERTGGFKLDGFKDIVPQKCKSDHYVKPFEILVACTDLTQNADIIGNAIMLLNNANYDEIIMSMDLVKLIPITDIVNNYMLYAIVNSKDFKNFALRYKSGTTVLHLNKNCFKEYTIKLPNYNTIKDLSKVFEGNYKKISQIIDENRKLEQLRDTLLPKLMNGEIDLDNIEI